MSRKKLTIGIVAILFLLILLLWWGLRGRGAGWIKGWGGGQTAGQSIGQQPGFLAWLHQLFSGGSNQPGGQGPVAEWFHRLFSSGSNQPGNQGGLSGWLHRLFSSGQGPSGGPVPLSPGIPVVPLPPPGEGRHPLVKPPPLPHPEKLPIAVSTGSVTFPQPVVSTAPVTPQVLSPVIPSVVPPGQEGMHRELIPKDITIVRCYYDEDVVNPGTTFAFSVNGSGFNEDFNRMISMDMDALDIDVKNLRLVTANQILGIIVVGPEATTEYVYPKVLIHGLPVFRAPDPFGVVRHGEVLDIQLTGIDETGQSGHFQAITNLDDTLLKLFHLEPTTPRLEISRQTSELPFYVRGDITIAPGLHIGSYGLTARIGAHELFRKDPLVDVVKPDVGRTGSVSRFKATTLAHRPGDPLVINLEGSGFVPSDANFLTATIDKFDMGQGSITYLSAGKMEVRFIIPFNTPVGAYGTVLRHKTKVIHQQNNVFGIVPPNWLSGARLPQPLAPGGKGTVQILGRDITPAFAQGLQIETDDPGLQVSGLRLQDNNTIVADVQVSTSVAPGDYLLHVRSGDRNLHLPSGSIIQINP